MQGCFKMVQWLNMSSCSLARNQWLLWLFFLPVWVTVCLKLLVLDVHIQSKKYNPVQYVLCKIDILILGPKTKIHYLADRHLGELPRSSTNSSVTCHKAFWRVSHKRWFYPWQSMTRHHWSHTPLSVHQENHRSS